MTLEQAVTYLKSENADREALGVLMHALSQAQQEAAQWRTRYEKRSMETDWRRGRLKDG